MVSLNLCCGNTKFGDIRFDRDESVNPDVVGDVHTLSSFFPERYFDRIECFESIEHWFYPLLALSEVYKVLKDDGVFVLSLPNVYQYRNFVRWFKSGKLAESCEHIYSWKWTNLMNIMDYVGFKIVNRYFHTFERFHRVRWFERWLPSRVRDYSMVVECVRGY